MTNGEWWTVNATQEAIVVCIYNVNELQFHLLQWRHLFVPGVKLPVATHAAAATSILHVSLLDLNAVRCRSSHNPNNQFVISAYCSKIFACQKRPV